VRYKQEFPTVTDSGSAIEIALEMITNSDEHITATVRTTSKFYFNINQECAFKNSVNSAPRSNHRDKSMN
jgi:hypothetical protein